MLKELADKFFTCETLETIITLTTKTMSSPLLIFILGVLAGILAFYIYGWIEKAKERRIICRSLMLEILYEHKARLHLELDSYRSQWQSGSYDPRINLLKYSTTTYDTFLPKLLYLKDYVAVQVNYYYRLVKDLNTLKDMKQEKIDDKFVHSYLKLTAHAYQMLFGVLDILSKKRIARKKLRESKEFLMDYEAPKQLERDIDILKHHQAVGAAKSLEERM